MILVDTMIIIDIWKGNLNVKKCLEKYKFEPLAISAISIQEIYDGLGYTKVKLGDLVYKKIKEQFESILDDYYIIPLDLKILKRAGIIKGELRAKGIFIDYGDYIIGATAQVMNAEKLITRNPDHFKEFNISIESYELE
ncbi:MAG: type II toxin-antitoxin system VapC family toxin [Promethearchaeota archaeon]